MAILYFDAIYCTPPHFAFCRDYLRVFFLVLCCVSRTQHKPAACSGLTALSPRDKLRELGFKGKAVLREEGEKHKNQIKLPFKIPAQP